MNQLSERPMSLIQVEFEELYQRHLCRHSELGINVLHLIGLWGIWYSFYGIIHWFIPSPWIMVALGSSFLILVAPNLPILVLASTALFVAGVCTFAYYVSLPWLWSYLVVFFLFYKIQTWSHKLYPIENDMTSFDRKYYPSILRFFILLLYEIPIVLNYLVFRLFQR